MHMRYAPPMFMFHGPLMLLSCLFWLVLLALLIGLVVRRFSGAGMPSRPPFAPRPGQPPFAYQPPMPQASAQEILRQRFARGEIDAATFDQMRERLEASERPRE
ncbi:MAG TPA: SHOCT domain-containing protein [Ktedonobacteraceae bacterium]|jgi:putative membrane protein